MALESNFIALWQIAMPSIPLTYHYIQLFAPSHTEELSLRKVLADALGQSYGLSRALTYIDVLAIDAAKGEATIRVSSGSVYRAFCDFESYRIDELLRI